MVDSQIFSRVTRKLLYCAIFFPNVFPGMQLLNWAYQKNLNQCKKVGGTKHSMSPGGKKVGGDMSPPSPTKLRPWYHTMLWYHKAQSYILHVGQYHKYDRILWHHSIVLASFWLITLRVFNLQVLWHLAINLVSIVFS